MHRWGGDTIHEFDNTIIRNLGVFRSQLPTPTSHSQFVHHGGKTLCWQGSMRFFLSKKMMNKLVHSRNGNRINRNWVKLAHWNMGNKLWQNKRTDIEAVLLEKSPDLLYISEANLFDTVPEWERFITGYTLHLPLTMGKHKYSRLVLLVKEGVDVEVQNNMMHEDLAMIWVSVKSGGRKIMKVGGVYREHQLLMKPKPNLTDGKYLLIAGKELPKTICAP